MEVRLWIGLDILIELAREIHVGILNTNYRACSAVVIVLRLVPKVLGSNSAFSTKHATRLLHVE
jgi:hypothetical protein